MSLPPYAKYDPHTRVPSHWIVAPLKSWASINDDVLSEATPADYELSYVDISSVSLEAGIGRTETLRFCEAPSRARRLVRHGDVIISTVRTYLKAIAPINSPPENLVVSTGFAVVRPGANFQPSFAKYALQSSVFIDEIISRSAGVSYPAINASEIARIKIPMPSAIEQSAIATFLDRETAKIDTLITEQEKLLALLAEKRQATISHVVTRGLHSDVPMKYSGVKWLGKVPAHWKIMPLMHLTNPSRPIMYGIVLPGPNVQDGVPIVKGGDVRPHRLRAELLNRTTPEIERPYARARLRPLDLVYSIRGTIGDVEVVPADLLDANITQDVARISPASGTQTRWLLYAMKSKPVFVQLEQRSLGAAVRGINIFELKRARVPVPPSEERDEISAFLDAETAKLDKLSVEAERAIGLLKKRRSALITAAVTGKIDVRNAVVEQLAA